MHEKGKKEEDLFAQQLEIFDFFFSGNLMNFQISIHFKNSNIDFVYPNRDS